MKPTTPGSRTESVGMVVEEPALETRFLDVRGRSTAIAGPLSAEDAAAQSMPAVSPAKWHLAHTSWFFETFVLERYAPGFEPFDPRFRVLFNSYYDTIGEQHPRSQRGLIARPGLDEVLGYRRQVDGRIARLLESHDLRQEVKETIELGLHHEQQHQELMLTDIKHVLSRNPARPAYAPPTEPARRIAPPLRWVSHDEGLREIGYDGRGFSFDNERPRHRVFVHAFEIGSRPVTCGDYLEFMEDGGYRRPETWLSDGWEAVRREGWRAPLYWEQREGAWGIFTLRGERAIDPGEPLCHVSYYEADAFARWSGARLPTECEWEVAAGRAEIEGNFAESGALHPAAAPAPGGPPGPAQLFGDVWEWTASAYLGYPGYRPLEGPLGEYNGKFMCGQMVLRGGSCATPRSHIRHSYRNFYYPGDRWQFTGLRLAREAR